MANKIYKYGETGAHVRIKCDLTSAQSIADAGGTITGTVNADEGGADFLTGSYIEFLPAEEADLNEGGQLIMELDKYEVAYDSLVGGGNANSLTSVWTSWDLSDGWIGTNGSTKYIQSRFASADTPVVLRAACAYPEMLPGGVLGQFIARWDADYLYYYFNGNYFVGWTRTTSAANSMDEFYVGNNQSNTTRFFPGKIKNVQLSADIFTPDTLPLLANVAVLSDSNGVWAFPNDALTGTGAQALSHGVGHGIKGYLHLVHGVDVTFGYDVALGPEDSWSYGGYATDDNRASPIGDKIPAMVADDPTIVVYLVTGLNDISASFNVATFKTSLAGHVEEVMANANTSGMIVCNVITPQANINHPTNAPPANYEELVNAANVATRQVVAEWQAANPSDADKVRHCDIFNALGGFNPPDNTYMGQLDGALDDFHLAAVGHEALADAIAPILYSLAAGIPSLPTNTTWRNHLFTPTNRNPKASLPTDVNGSPIPTLSPRNTSRADPTSVIRVDLPVTPQGTTAQIVRVTSDGDLYIEFGDSTVTATSSSTSSFLFLKGSEIVTVPAGTTFLGFVDAGGTVASTIEVTRMA